MLLAPDFRRTIWDVIHGGKELFKDDYYMYRRNKEQSKKLNNYDRLQIENEYDEMIKLYGDIKIKFA